MLLLMMICCPGSAKKNVPLNTFADRDERIIIFWCAKEAVSKALGIGLLGNMRKYRVINYDLESGQCLVMYLELTFTVQVIKRKKEIIAICVDPDPAHI
jgi:phosphopantetheinyl transferase